MVLDGDDRPFASFLWPGNTADVTRLMPVVRRLRERFGIAQVIVADRGMISAAAIATLEKAGLQYILRVRERSTKEVRSEVIEDDGVAVPLTIARQKGETQLAIKETTLKGRRYVLCRNEEEARKDADSGRGAVTFPAKHPPSVVPPMGFASRFCVCQLIEGCERKCVLLQDSKLSVVASLYRAF
jgi:Transposase DDE domain